MCNLLLLHRHCRLRVHVAQRLRIGCTSSHTLPTNILSWHSTHTTSLRMLSAHALGSHAVGTGLHAHHGSGLSDVRSSGPRNTRVHLHLLWHLVRSGRHSRVAMWHARLGLVGRGHDGDGMSRRERSRRRGLCQRDTTRCIR